MTVKELFDHFTRYFDEICYFDKTHNIQDTEYAEIGRRDEQYDEFVNEYGNYEVIEWEFTADENKIDITIEE